MGYGVHCRRRDGKLVYRIWTTFSDRYITGEITKEQARGWLLNELLARAEENFVKYDFPRTVQEAESRGASGLGDSVSLDDPWKEPIKQPEPD